MMKKRFFSPCRLLTACILLLPAVLTAAPEPPKEATIRLVNRSYQKGASQITALAGEVVSGIRVEVAGAAKKEGVQVVFRLVATPSKAKSATLKTELATTDGSGTAATLLNATPRAGTYIITAYLPAHPEVPPVSIKVDVSSKGWYIMVIIGLLGGLGMFLYGMKMSADGLQHVAGSRMKDILSKYTTNPVKGHVVGFAATAAMQSSSATSAMCVGFVSATLMTLAQTLSVMQGARIGTTITAQLVAFRLADFSLLLVLAGFIMISASKKKRIKSLGEILAGFGLIFFGMGVMSDAMAPLRSNPDFTTMLLSLGEKPMLGLLGAAIFTAIIQSSGATVGLCIAFADQGLITLGGAIPLAIGAMIGTTMTGLLAALGANRDGKRVAVANLIFSVIAAAVCLPVLGILETVTVAVTKAMGSDSLPRQVANGYTLLSVWGVLVCLPFLKPLEKLVMKLMPEDAAAKEKFAPIYLQEGFENAPDIALDLSHKELMRMSGIVAGMIARIPGVYAERSEEAIDAIIKEDDKVDLLDEAIRPYLNTVGRGSISEEQSRSYMTQLYLTGYLEGMGDIIVKNIMPQARKLVTENFYFEEKELMQLQDLADKSGELFTMAMEAFDKKSYEIAEQVTQLFNKYARLGKKLYQDHFATLRTNTDVPLEHSSVYLDTIDKMVSLTSQINTIAGTIIEEL